MKKSMVLFPLSLALLVLWGCEPNARGFALPEGDVERGKATFQQLGCTQCHSISDIAWQGSGDDVEVPLGGVVPGLKTYGELVTSVINPSHRIARAYLGEDVAVDGESTMRRYNEFMTVQQLVDIVSYLQTEYDIVVPSNHYVGKRW
ncbi:cytochrome c family protein [Luminiphilus syltensis NOR5-1B]|uniref:Cytochrome c family protein n=1 Tax=Luminiphilus syltensis NOR5-1B TaxID=565045 RepID=B8KTD8_9GAMM|nr:c-type cytochrome [Luminiphilus syltensis]EED34847.1 cytochrome c family protein [Luminiphilus syltensis NOR5-1B]